MKQDSHILVHTPVETYGVGDTPVWVKREDLCTPSPGPTFSKVRGLFPVLMRLRKNGVTHVGYTESAISMAGWGVAWACQVLGMTAVIFDPQYKNTPALLKYHRGHWNKFNATIIPIPAGRAKVGWYQSRHLMKKHFPDKKWELLPLGLPFPETVTGASVEMKYTIEEMKYKPNSLVVAVGSGTVAAGVIRACSSSTEIFGVLCRTGDMKRKLKTMSYKGNWTIGGLMSRRKVSLVDPGYNYTDLENIITPFPCHPYYDAKAWKWLVMNIKSLRPPIMFWNIGS